MANRQTLATSDGAPVRRENGDANRDREELASLTACLRVRSRNSCGTRNRRCWFHDSATRAPPRSIGVHGSGTGTPFMASIVRIARHKQLSWAR
jgi:hypothetical protein